MIDNHKSEIFSNSEATNQKPAPRVSKSLVDEKSYLLKDSLKMYQNNNNNNANADQRRNLSDASSSKNKKKSSNLELVSSSSSSSIDSSSDDDPGKQLIRMEQRDKKEISSFINKLNSTLNKANNVNMNDSEVDMYFEDALDEETFEDLEKDVIEADERLKQQQPPQPPQQHQQQKVKYDDIDDNYINFLPKRSSGAKLFDELDDKVNLADLSLGSTNHMQQRVKQMEKEIVDLIGREKLDESFAIFESFKEDEVKAKLIKLLGQEQFEAHGHKLWLIKFCKDTAKISVH